VDDIQLHIGQGGDKLAAKEHALLLGTKTQRGLLTGFDSTGMPVDVGKTYPLPVQEMPAFGAPYFSQLSLDGAGAVINANGDYTPGGVDVSTFRTPALPLDSAAYVSGLRLSLFNDVDSALFSLLDYWGTFLPSNGWELWRIDTPYDYAQTNDYQITANPIVVNPHLIEFGSGIRQMPLATGMGGTVYSYGVVDIPLPGSVTITSATSIAIRLSDDYTELEVHEFLIYGQFFTPSELAGDPIV
jgi:hypothetical protein